MGKIFWLWAAIVFSVCFIFSACDTEGETRRPNCPLTNCEEVWQMKDYGDYSWQITESENYITDTVRHFNPPKVEPYTLKIIEARTKLNYKLLSRNSSGAPHHFIQLCWEKPKK